MGRACPLLAQPYTFRLGLVVLLVATVPPLSHLYLQWASECLGAAAASLAMLAASSLSFLPRPFCNSPAAAAAAAAAPLPHPRQVSLVRSQHKPPRSSSFSVQETSPQSQSQSMAAKWAQKTVVLPAQKRGCHLVTSTILREIQQDLSGFKCGLAHFFLQHTSASLTINENYDSDVQVDMETFLSRIVPEGYSAPWKHTLEGPDDMPAHVKSSMFGCALTIPITDGRLGLGTWQGIWLCEHRDHATARKIVITLNGM